mmetsp:Transcript_32162/g.113185  ORF Transcript_32162/g.113185 Transcript_32162/m.113185 type:complete len:224 (+) Transcript_32162:3758-4429(+)
MAWIHMHRPLAAEETFATSSTCISGMTMYFEIFLITSGFMLSLSYPFNLSRNCASPRTRFASSQSTFERSSMMQMPSMVILTAGAGDLNALTSEMSFFVSELSAFTAEFSAGMATSRSACASAAMRSHSMASLPMRSLSDSTCLRCSSATRRSETISTSRFSQSFCAWAQMIFFFSSSTDMTSTPSRASTSLARPFFNLSRALPISSRFSESIVLYPLTSSKK